MTHVSAYLALVESEEHGALHRFVKQRVVLRAGRGG